MARRGRSALSVQLFPFLAVLVCVMGSLILLLIVTTRKMRQQAVARALAAQFIAEAPAAPLEPEPVAPPENIEADDLAARRAALLSQLAALRAARDRQSAALDQQRLLTSAARRRMQAVQEQIVAGEQNLGAISGQMTATRLSAPNADAERQQIEQQILRLRRQLKRIEDQQRATEGKYTLVPFDGKSGTTRRPIFIECTDTGFRFMAEGVTIRPSEVQGFSDQYNPLLAGAAALSAYWNQHDNSNDPNAEPYVLLIVRPSGTVAYYISQKLLARLKTPFGYELVSDDVELSVPPAEPGAKAACQTAVQKLLSNREHAMIGGATPRGTGNGFDSGTGSGSGSGNGSGGGPENGSRGGAPGGFGNGSGGGAGKPAGGGQRTGAASGSGNGSGDVVVGNAEAGKPGGQSTGQPGGQRAGQPGGFSLADLDAQEGVGERTWENVERFEGREFHRPASGSRSGAGSGTGSAPGSGSGSPSGTGSGSKSTAQAANGGGNARNPQSPDNTGDNDVEGDSEGNGGSANGSSTAQGGPTPRRNRPSAARGAPGGTMSNGVTTADYNQNKYPPFAKQHQNGRQDQRSGGLPYEQLQRRKWGQHSANANIGLEHEVLVRVDAQRIVVDNAISIPVPNGIGRNELFDRLLSVVDRQSYTWGMAPSGFFWIPSLKFVISPGGNYVYDRLQPLLTKSGLASYAEFTLDENSPPQTQR